MAGKFLNFYFNGQSSSQNINCAFVWLAPSKFLKIDFNGQSSYENLNSVFGEEGMAAGQFCNLAFNKPSATQTDRFEGF